MGPQHMLPAMSPSSSTTTFSVTSSASTTATSSFESPVAIAKSQLALLQCPAASTSERSPTPARPSFNSQVTNDRLRESYAVRSPFTMETKIRRDRKSIFKELDMDDPSPVSPSLAATLPSGLASPSLDESFKGLGMRKSGTGSSTLSIPQMREASIVSAPTSPIESGHGRPKKSLSVRNPPSTRAVSFNTPHRAVTSIAPTREEPLIEETETAERGAPKRKWFVLSRPKLKTATSAPPPTLRSLAGGTPTRRNR
ncbi:hypothetical protein MKZ38_010081 [Zalerion maritima]|uniref:Uncharacterized protein n=1 Tax=Zalerion maritima TaxID=339359 RepID=A0AAD5RUJ7_9PEZI|nr:hypothetical protein MKZ38_010081 [Zalerion maritima]